jgi:methionyl aminopeptidase
LDGDAPAEKRSKQQSFIEVKNKKQIEGVRLACQISREVLDIAAAAVKPGITTDEIDRIVHEATIARNAYPSPLNYHKFPKSCCTSVNEVICHGIPDFRPLKEGDIVNLDISCYYGGYHGDVNATYYVGGIEKVDEDSKRLVETTRECLNAAIDICRPGTFYREIGNVIQKIAQAKGLSVVRSYCGHGIGEHFHTAPSVPHYGKNKAVGVMKPGHVFTIEPMINLGTWQDQLWPDNWTSTTRDGKRSAQFEHTLLVTETGIEILTGPKF